jgi:hypothetical protein
MSASSVSRSRQFCLASLPKHTRNSSFLIPVSLSRPAIHAAAMLFLPPPKSAPRFPYTSNSASHHADKTYRSM